MSHIDHFVAIIRAVHEADPNRVLTLKIDHFGRTSLGFKTCERINSISLSPNGVDEDTYVPELGAMSHAGRRLVNDEDPVEVAKGLLRP